MFSFHFHRELRAVTTPPFCKSLITEASGFSQFCLIEGEGNGQVEPQLKELPTPTKRSKEQTVLLHGQGNLPGKWLIHSQSLQF